MLQPQAEGTLLRGSSGGPLSLNDLRSLVMCAAYGAGLDGSQPRRPLEQIDLVLPALRDMTG